MSFIDWIRGSARKIQKNGAEGVSDAVYELYVGLWRRYGYLKTYGQPIYEEGWDVLIILDACRYDLFYEFIIEENVKFSDTVNSFESLGTDSGEWMMNNFTDEYLEEMRQTVMVTGNPHSNWLLDDSDFLELDEVWNYAWDEDIQTVPPRPLTDRAIQHSRKKSPERLIIHYMQPHYPFVPQPLGGGVDPDNVGNTENSVWKRLRRGELELAAVQEGYKKNLEYVMEDVILLLNNIDADTVVISADHGNAVGEHGIYGHPRSVPIDPIVNVPWYTTSATDSGEYTPTIEPDDGDHTTVKEQLEALGYA